MASAPEPAAAHSKCAMPNGVPYWLVPPISIIGLLTWPTKASSTKPRADEAARQKPLEHAIGRKQQRP